MQSNTDQNRVLHIVTRCSRINNIITVGQSIPVKDDGIQWHIIFDSSVLKDVSTEILSTLQRDYNAKLYFEYSQNDYLYTRMNNIIIDNIKDGWVYSLDDDNILHEELFDNFKSYLDFCEQSNLFAMIFNQDVSYKDWTDLDVRFAKPENMRVTKIDLAQFILHRTVFNNFEFEARYDADGRFIERLHENNPDRFLFIDKILSYYNYL